MTFCLQSSKLLAAWLSFLFLLAFEVFEFFDRTKIFSIDVTTEDKDGFVDLVLG